MHNYAFGFVTALLAASYLRPALALGSVHFWLHMKGCQCHSDFGSPLKNVMIHKECYYTLCTGRGVFTVGS